MSRTTSSLLSFKCFSGTDVSYGYNCLFEALGRVSIKGVSLLELTRVICPGYRLQDFPTEGAGLRLCYLIT